MKIKITNDAKLKLKKYFSKNKKVILDLDDGVGPFSKEGTCALITKFRLLVVDSSSDLSDYPIHLNSDLGTIYFKNSAEAFLDNGVSLDVDPKTQLLIFSNTKETIDKRVNIIE